MMKYTVTKLSENDYWLEDDSKTPFPASFLNRQSAELVAVLLNATNQQRVQASLEPVRVTLDVKPAAKPGQVQASIRKISLNTPKPRNRTLTVKAKEEKAPEPQPEDVKVVI